MPARKKTTVKKSVKTKVDVKATNLLRKNMKKAVAEIKVRKKPGPKPKIKVDSNGNGVIHDVRLDRLSGKIVEKVVIFDIDGCIADDAWRHAFIAHNAPNVDLKYAVYHEKSIHDHVLEHGANRLNSYLLGERSKGLLLVPPTIVFSTARPEFYRDLTTAWLLEKFPRLTGRSWRMYMRKDLDDRPAPEIKGEHIRALVFDGFKIDDIEAAHDDRIDVCNMYRHCGVKNVHITDATGIKSHNPTFEENVSAFMASSFPWNEAIIKGAANLTFAGAPTVGKWEPNPIKHEFKGEFLRDHPVAKSLLGALETLQQRHEQYGRTDEVYRRVMKVLFPEGVRLDSAERIKTFTMFSHVIGKCVRFATTDMKHTDSIHDAMNYAGFTLAALNEENAPSKNEA